MLASPTVEATNRVEEYASEVDGSWQQLMVSPKTKDNMEEAQGHLEAIEDQVEDNARIIVAAMEMVIQKMGYSAEEAQVLASRQANMGFISALHGVPAGLINPESSSFAQLYADRQMLRTDMIEPLGQKICRELSRLTPFGWDFCLDYEHLDRGDPKTQTEIANARIKGGMWSVNRGLRYIGDAPLGDVADEANPYNRPMVDGNRVFVDKLDDVVDSVNTQRLKKSEGRPKEDDKQPKADYPKTETPTQGE